MMETEKIKKWLIDKKEKGVKWCIDNRGFLGYMSGLGVAAAVVIIVDKIFEPKKGCIEFTSIDNGNALGASVYALDRFNKEDKLISIKYVKNEHDMYLTPMLTELDKFLNP